MVGRLKSPPVIWPEKEKAQYTIETLRRNEKIDTPTITAYGAEMLNIIQNANVGDFILLKGVLTTRDVRKGWFCPSCNKPFKIDGTLTTVVAISHVNIGSNYELEEFQEMSNLVILLGALCREPESWILPITDLPSTKYQIAVNRRFRIEQEPDDIRTDYPWVNSFGRQAEEDHLRLQKSSQVYIQGGLQTREIDRHPICVHCGHEFVAKEMVAEVVPYGVEYLNNCIFE